MCFRNHISYDCSHKRIRLEPCDAAIRESRTCFARIFWARKACRVYERRVFYELPCPECDDEIKRQVLMIEKRMARDTLAARYAAHKAACKYGWKAESPAGPSGGNRDSVIEPVVAQGMMTVPGVAFDSDYWSVGVNPNVEKNQQPESSNVAATRAAADRNNAESRELGEQKWDPVLPGQNAPVAPPKPKAPAVLVERMELKYPKWEPVRPANRPIGRANPPPLPPGGMRERYASTAPDDQFVDVPL